MKNRLKGILSILAFFALFFFLFGKTSYLLQYKIQDYDVVSNFYEEKKDSIDVLFVGSSHVYHGFSPMQIWGETGISSYALSTPSQSIPCSYYLIKEGIRQQHPKVIVMEAFAAKYDGDYDSIARAHAAFDGIPMNSTKWEILTEFLPRTLNPKGILEFVFPIIRFHDRWDSLKERDFHRVNPFLKGFIPSSTVKKQSKPGKVKRKGELYAGTIEYFDRIVQLCRENGIALVLCRTPIGTKHDYKGVLRNENALIELAKESGVPFIDFIQLEQEIGFDYATDFKDSTHVNTSGAAKITHYMAEYLEKEYVLEDHRQDEEYASWEKDYEAYLALLASDEELDSEDEE